jgi:hypothetical protein
MIDSWASCARLDSDFTIPSYTNGINPIEIARKMENKLKVETVRHIVRRYDSMKLGDHYSPGSCY